ncbi:SHOCT domain-containing protein [Primorskyibacter sp. S87]|uniref:SHOCT domain-containing protein n=1 Tax=Primorskyibacter sp. S87 TaxID=3415126 RepID=UPI003C79A75D
MTKSILLAGMIGVATLSLAACGSRTKTETNVKATTTGQELTDLQRALNEGVITQDEYDKKREQILKDG